MPVSNLPLADLAHHCAEETEKFNRRYSSDPQFCFELWRRAFAEEMSDALTYIYNIYERQIISWVYNHNRFGQTGESAEFFAQAALRKIYFALRGEKFLRFPGLSQVLSYLKCCIHTEIVQYLRDQRSYDWITLDLAHGIAITTDFDTHTASVDIWTQISQLLPDERDRLLAHYTFFQDLKPSQIMTIGSGLWSNEREISIAIYRIRRILRNSAQLRRLLGLPESEYT